MKNSSRLYIFFIAIFFWSCTEEQPSNLVIRGTLPGLSGEKLYLEELHVKSREMIDSTIIRPDGSFSFQFTGDEAGFYILGTSEANQLILQADKGQEILVNSENQQFEKGYNVIGSPGSELLLSFEDVLQQRKKQVDSLAEVYYAAQGEENFMQKKAELDSAYREIIEEHQQYIDSFIREHPGALSSLIVLNRRLGNTKVIDEEDDFHLFHLTDSALMINYPDNPHVTDHHKRVKKIRLSIFDKAIAEEKVRPGKKAPDIVLNDTAGNPFSLKSFTGHPVIVYFWAGWNAKSRADNLELVAMYDELQEAGVEILGVSLDENKVVWKGAVKLDQLPWQQVSDLSGLNSPVKKDFNLPDELPYYYLLDENLTIRYKNNKLDSVLIHLEKLFL